MIISKKITLFWKHYSNYFMNKFSQNIIWNRRISQSKQIADSLKLLHNINILLYCIKFNTNIWIFSFLLDLIKGSILKFSLYSS